MGRAEILNQASGLRQDGRRINEIRRMVCRVGHLPAADGSAYVEMGNTKVLAAVYGPRAASTMQITNKGDKSLVVNCEYSIASFSTGERKKRVKTDRSALEMSRTIRVALESAICADSFTESQIYIFVQVLEADGGSKAACINAASAALAHAGIAMIDLTTCCSSGCIGGTPILDLNLAELGAGGPELTVAFLPNRRKVTLFQSSGKTIAGELDGMMDSCIAGCKIVHALMRETLLEFVHAECAARANLDT